MVRRVTPLDGSRVDFDAPATLAAHGSIGVTLDRRELTANVAGFSDTLRAIGEASDDYQIRSIDRHPLSQGTAVIADLRRRDVDLGQVFWYEDAFAIWEGQRYSLFLHDSTPALALATLNQLTFFEDESGLVVRDAKGRSLNWLTPPNVVTEVPGIVQIEVVPLTKAVSGRLPRHRGTTVRGGELFRQELSQDEATHYFVLVTDTAVVNGVPLPGTDEQDTVDVMADSLVVWSE